MASRLVYISLALVSLGVALAGPVAASQFVSFSATHLTSRTDWIDVLSLPRFDPATGALVGVVLEITTELTGYHKFENRIDTPATITSWLSSTTGFTVAGTSASGSAYAVDQQVVDATAYDGTLDYLGGSGRTYDNILKAANAFWSSTAPADLLWFTGTDSFSADIAAVGDSGATGSGWISFRAANSVSLSLPSPKARDQVGALGLCARAMCRY